MLSALYAIARPSVCLSVRQTGVSLRTRKPSWCWHTRATQKRWKKFFHFEVI